MRKWVPIMVGALVAVIAAEIGYAAGATFQAPPIKTVTHTIRRTRTVDVPGPVRWRSRQVSVLPQTCVSAITSGTRMARLIDEYSSLVSEWRSLEVATFYSVTPAYYAGVQGKSSQATVNTLKGYKGRTAELDRNWSELISTWKAMNWKALWKDCRNAQ